jgi:hypothetical protein
MTLVEGTDVVEVTGGHLRIVVGDPAYAGWTWRHPGAWYEDWWSWVGRWGGQRYAESWRQKLTRTVDPGFHSLRLNSVAIEPVPAPPSPGAIVFRDVFDRDDGPDINHGMLKTLHWRQVDLDEGGSSVRASIDKTTPALTGTASRSTVAFVQMAASPGRGVVRYSTRVSVFTGEGSRAGSGHQEAGLVLLGDSDTLTDSRLTFVGVTVGGPDGGGFTVRAGGGERGPHADLTVRPPLLPFRVAAGDHEIVVDHDIDQRLITRIAVNGLDVTSLVPAPVRRSRLGRGRFGLRARLDPGRSGVALGQYYSFLHVECRSPRPRACS